MSAAGRLTERDLESLRRRGIAHAEAERQLRLLRDPPPALRLDRPATVGDGIVRLATERREALARGWEERGLEVRPSKLVPASGAATRMFRAVRAILDAGPFGSLDELRRAAAGDENAAATVELLEAIDELPFAAALAQELARRGLTLERARPEEPHTVLAALLEPDGLGYDALPKGLLPFHRAREGARTPFEEHLDEAPAFLADRDRRCRLHFTVPPEHRAGFEERLAAARPRLEREYGVRFEIAFSVQDPATDTLALERDADRAGRPFRLDDGSLLLRPGGHGALLANLGAEAAHGDPVFVQNIDNVLPADRRGPSIHWRAVLGGLLLELRAELRRHLRLLTQGDPGALEEVLRFARDALSATPPAALSEPGGAALRRFLRHRLDRPLRVCAMVPNQGEPGGGPFWVRAEDGGLSLQIVESAQVDPDSEEQRGIFASGTHFNPVNLVCGMRDADGTPYDLERFVDPQAVVIAEKTHEGRPLLALERPGLWNGAMAGWNTVFVEVPIETFAPVKTVLDLLRPEHRA